VLDGAAGRQQLPILGFGAVDKVRRAGHQRGAFHVDAGEDFFQDQRGRERAGRQVQVNAGRIFGRVVYAGVVAVGD